MDADTQILRDYLQRQRDALIWKLDGLSERDLRMPMTVTGTNLLGIVKHVASIEQGYLVGCFGRPVVEPTPWLEMDAEDNADMWATAEQSRDWVVDFYRRVWSASDATIAELPLDATGTVPWWAEDRRHPSLHRLVIHVIAETARHAGHADIVREHIDGAAGLAPNVANLPPQDSSWWQAYVDRLRDVAHSFSPRD